MTEQEYKEMIYKKASQVKTKEELNALLDEITEYKHDYGTIIYGIMAAMKASFRVVNESPNGGITGFQAGCLGWECVHEFMMIGSPARILDYNNLLFPQYKSKFDKVISQETWDNLVSKAKTNLIENKTAHPNVIAHWKSCADGILPFGFTIGEQ